MRIFVRTERRQLLLPHGGGVEVRGELAPDGALAAHVATVRWGRDRFTPALEERVVPDGAVHLVFSLGDRPAAVVVGASATPRTIRLEGTLEQVGVELRPGGIAALLGADAGSLGDGDLPLAALWGAEAGELLERLAALPLAARPGAVVAALSARLRRARAAHDPRAAAAVRTVLGARGQVNVRAVADAVGVGERRLEQLFRREVGLTPKALCRVTRFRATVDFAHDGGERSWGAIAQACGYSDQAHLTHEFRAIAGVTPGHFGFFQDPPAAPR